MISLDEANRAGQAQYVHSFDFNFELDETLWFAELVEMLLGYSISSLRSQILHKDLDISIVPLLYEQESLCSSGTVIYYTIKMDCKIKA